MSARVILGDCLAVLPTLPTGSVDACVTDPPAGIAFMGKSWDGDKGGRQQWVAWMTEVFTEVHRVLKPGAHGFVWALPRTSHWTAWALEDAGFEIRDCVYHLFGSGFPKSLDISKAIDKAAGAEREVVGQVSDFARDGSTRDGSRHKVSQRPYQGRNTAVNPTAWDLPVTAPATPDAERWQGWGTALKPAAECWWLIRKPLSERTVAANVLAHGTGGLNIDAARINPGEMIRGGGNGQGGRFGGRFGAHETNGTRPLVEPHTAGRWPSNVALSHEPECREIGVRRVSRGHGAGQSKTAGTIYGNGQGLPPSGWFDYADADGTETVAAWECAESCAVAALDRMSGERKSGATSRRYERTNRVNWRAGSGREREASTGGASRFFLTVAQDRFSTYNVENQGAQPCGDASTEAASTSAGKRTESSADNLHTDGPGSRQTALSPRDTKSITGITTPSTTTSLTSPVSHPKNTTPTTTDSERITVSSMASSSAGVNDAASTSPSASSSREPTGHTRGTATRAPGLISRSGDRQTESTTTPTCAPIESGEPQTRFFYTSKASPSERGAYNDHPCTKSLALMTWLIKLAVPPGGVVLDPFCGSGTTLLAASRLGFDAIGIDSDAHAISICKRRLYEDSPMFSESVVAE